MHQRVRRCVEEIVEGRGYVVVPDAIDAARIREIRDLVQSLAEEERKSGRIHTEGRRERVLRLEQRDPIFGELYGHPLIIEVAEQLLATPRAEIGVSGCSAHIVHPGASSMGMHVGHPYAFMKGPLPERPILAIEALFMLNDFTADNGATRFVPESQKRLCHPDPVDFERLALKVTGEAGTLIIYHALCWHDSSPNSSQDPRIGFLCGYTVPGTLPVDLFFQAIQAIGQRG